MAGDGCATSPRRFTHADHLRLNHIHGYWLVDLNRNTLVAGGQFGMDIDAVEEWLTSEPEEGSSGGGDDT